MSKVSRNSLRDIETKLRVPRWEDSGDEGESEGIRKNKLVTLKLMLNLINEILGLTSRKP